MRVNGEEFTIYNGDDKISIRERISAKINSTLFWTEFIFAKGKQEIKAINILQDVQEKLDTFVKFSDLESTYENWLKHDQDIDKNKKLAILYILKYIEGLDETDFNVKITLEYFFADDGGTDYNWDFIEKTINDKERLKQEINTDILDLKRKVEKRTEILEKTCIGEEENREDEEEILTTKPTILSVVTTLSIETEQPVVLSHLFNSLKVTDNFLFAKFSDFYKVNENNRNKISRYEPEITQENSSDSCVFIVFIVKDVKKKIFYREITIKQLDDKKFKIDLDIIGKTIDYEELGEIFMNIPYEITNQEKTRIKAEYFIQNTTFNKELFSDEVMNNEQFSNFYINERQKVTKIFSKINLFYYSITTSTVSFSIVSESGSIKVFINKIFSKEYLDEFITMFNSYFSVYKRNEKTLLSTYKKFFHAITLAGGNKEDQAQDPEDRVEQEIKEKPKKPPKNLHKNQLARLEPTLFVPLYTRKCAKPPRILEEKDKTPRGFQTMDFPLYGEGGLKPRKYVCDKTGTFKYPGIRKNSLANNEVFKFIPCCYETDQRARKGSYYNLYLEQNLHQKIDKYEHSLYKTSRALPNENSGTLPLGIEYLFKNKVRKGVFLGPNSFIDCVSRASGKYNTDIYDEPSRIDTLEKIRQKLNVGYCLQENYDILENVHEWFYDNEMYFDPRRFFRAVENFFEVNIYIFEKSTDHTTLSDTGEIIYIKQPITNGTLSLPNIPPKGIYIDPKRYKKSVFIYVHHGSAIDKLTMPHCEWISSETGKSEIESIYRYLLIKSNKNLFIPKENRKKFSLQYIDSMGRCCRLVTKKGKILKLKTPILPLKLPYKLFFKTIEERDVDHLQSFKESFSNSLTEHLYLKRLARVFLEYCMIKFSISRYQNIDDFISSETKIINNFSYKPLKSDKYLLKFYDKIFTYKNKIIFESLDTQKRIQYSMDILLKRNGIKKYADHPYIHDYFKSSLDFDNNLVLTKKSFSEFINAKPQGLVFINSLEEITNQNLVLIVNFEYPELEGYYHVFNSLDELKDNMLQTEEYDNFYLFLPDGFKKYTTEGSGLTIIVYKLNFRTYYLGKINNF